MIKINFLTLKDMELEGKKVLVRADFNVPIKNGMVEDDTRLKATIPTINFLLEKNCKIILMSHLGRPKDLLKEGKSFEEVKKELSKLLNPERPFIAVVAGAKADKIGALKALAKKADKILIAGVLANTFLKAKGVDIGASKFDEETFNAAKEIIGLAGNKLKFPVDCVVADKFDNGANTRTVAIDNIPEGWMALDIGQETIESYKDELKDAKTVFWAGPLGVFEMEKFSAGTREIGEFLGNLNCAKIVGGGDTGAAINSFNLADKMTYVSTGGGASLEFIEKEGKLPALVALEKAYNKSKE